jgi:hypothetical protein
LWPRISSSCTERIGRTCRKRDVAESRRRCPGGVFGYESTG